MAELIVALPFLRYAPYFVELVAVIRENYRNPLVWSFFIKIDALKMTHRIRKYILNGESQEAIRLKDSFKDTLALEAVAVRFAILNSVGNKFIVARPQLSPKLPSP